MKTYKYFDSTATTKPSSEVLDCFVKASENFYNPSNLYRPSVEVKKEFENARKYILSYLKGEVNSFLLFTSSASEANNSVMSFLNRRKDKNYIITAGEHSSVYLKAKDLISNGFNVRICPITKDGRVDEEKLYSLIDENTVGITIIHVSNETGAINDIEKIAKKVKQINREVLIHVDGVQALGKIKIDLKKLDIDFYTISAHKINGVRGIAGLYIKNPKKFAPLIFGGEQERGLRGGTENVAGAISFKTAIENIEILDFSEYKRVFIENLDKTLDYYIVSNDNCISEILSICFKGVRGETVMHLLEEKGFIVGTGSACNSKLGYNRVLSEIVPKKYIEGAIRVSFSKENTLEDVKNLSIAICEAVSSLLKILKK